MSRIPQLPFKHGAIDAIGYMDRIQADIARAQQPLTQDDKVVLCVGAGLSIFMVIVAFFVA